MINLVWINDNIAISPAFGKEDIKKIKDNGVDAIIDVRSEYCDDQELIKRSGMQFLHVEIDDRYTPTEEQLEAIFNFVGPLLNQNKKILVHCQNGYGRSSLVAIAILVKRGLKPEEAIRILEDRHPLASFTPEQEKFIYNLREIINRSNRNV